MYCIVENFTSSIFLTRQEFYNERNSKKISTNWAETPSDKRPYHKPKLQSFGRVHLLTQGSGPENGDGGQTMMQPPMSDRGIKENIVHIGVHPLGIGLYLFDYKPEFRKQWSYGRQFGVMADEVEQVMPAVSVHPDGYKMVNYALLGISRVLH